MPKRKDGRYQHWYNFVVPTERLEAFHRIVEQIKKPDLSLRDDIIPTKIGDTHVVLRHSIDLVFDSDQKGMPTPIHNLMNTYDGVDVYSIMPRKASQYTEQEPALKEA